MGWTIKIGPLEAVEMRYTPGAACLDIKVVEFEERTDEEIKGLWIQQGINKLDQSYGSFKEFLDETGLYEFFKNGDEKEGLGPIMPNKMNDSVDYFIKRGHLDRLKEALKKEQQLVESKKRDFEGSLVLLKWFVRWMEWALKAHKKNAGISWS